MRHESLRDRVVLITGASSGIGEACAVSCSQAGMHVVLTARRTDRLEGLAQRLNDAGGSALAVTGDVTHAEEMRHAVARAVLTFGRLDVIVCNAGLGYYGRVEDTTAEALARLLDVNLMGSFHAAQAALPQFRRQARGHLIFVSSIVGRRAVPGSGVYAATKFAQTGLAEALRSELLGSGIVVSTIYPVSTDTEFRDAAARAFGHTAGGLGPRQSPEIVARAVLRLIERPRPESYPFRAGRLLAAAAVLLPSWCDRVVQRFERRRQPQAGGNGGGS
jgi:NADP-dependent 3-hydroxy acid dehydrogenase YdfG